MPVHDHMSMIYTHMKYTDSPHFPGTYTITLDSLKLYEIIMYVCMLAHTGGVEVSTVLRKMQLASPDV